VLANVLIHDKSNGRCGLAHASHKDIHIVTKKKAANKKKKKNEKQEKPPRAPSAYMIFCSEKRKSVMEMTNDDGEKLSFGEVTKTLAAQWKALGEDEKKIYTEKQKLQAAEVQAKEN